MLARSALLRNAFNTTTRIASRRTFADSASAAVSDSDKLSLNFFVPHQTIKQNAQVVRESFQISIQVYSFWPRENVCHTTFPRRFVLPSA